MTSPDYQSWFPPDLDTEVAAGIADRYWASDPHLAAALAWEAYAATLPPSPVVSQVNTGAQTVAYEPPLPAGELGLALQRAAWHRGFLGDLVSVPLAVASPAYGYGVIDLTPTWGVDP